MQTQHLIIAAYSTLGLLLMAHFIRQALLRAFARSAATHASYHQEQVATLTNDIILHSEAPKTESVPTWADHQMLLQVNATLVLAEMTWRAIPGTELTQLKAEKQARMVIEFANRASKSIELGAEGIEKRTQETTP